MIAAGSLSPYFASIVGFAGTVLEFVMYSDERQMRRRSARHGPSTAFSSCLTSPVGTVYSSTLRLYGSGKLFVFTFRYFCLQPVFIDFISSFNV